MDNRKWLANAAGSAPPVPSSPSTGYPTDGSVSTPATTPGAYWYYALSEEIRNVILAAGLTPTHNQTNQLLASLNAGFGLDRTLAATGYATMPGGLILQWGGGNTAAATGQITVTFPIAFPNMAFRSFANHAGQGGAFAVTKNLTKTNVLVSTSIDLNATTQASFAFNYLAIGF